MNHINQPKSPSRFWLYVSATLFVLFLLATVGTFLNLIMGDFLSATMKASADKDLTKFMLSVGLISVIAIIIYLVHFQANHWRSQKGELNLGFTSYRNPFYDPRYKSESIREEYDHLANEHQQLLKQYDKINKRLSEYMNYADELQENNDEVKANLNVFLRHHENARRLMESIVYRFRFERDSSWVEKTLQDVLNECITILQKDHSDKSVSLFTVEEDDLKIRKYVRIKAESVAKRVFKKGEGFAGVIWATCEPDIVNEKLEEDSRFGDKLQHHFKSIIGVPVKVEGIVLGVLCIQSEKENGFSEDDLRAVEFYANTCAFLLLYDKISVKDHGEEGD